MDIRDLQVFLAVVKHLNFTRAGEEVHLSQPSVSVRIRRLEDELQVKLFEQVNKKVVLLEAGRVLESHAWRAVAALADACKAIEDLKGLEFGSLRIGASTTPGMYLVPRIIAEFKRQHPKILISLNIRNTRQVEIDVTKNEFDLGFVGGHLVSDDIEWIPWRTDEIVLIVPPNHCLAKRKQIKLNDLANEQLLCREPGSATRAEVEKKLAALDFRLGSAADLDNPEAVKQAVANGLGIAFISQFAVETDLRAKTLVAVKVQSLRINRELKIIYRRGKHLSQSARALIETAQKLQR
jgi:LysR family transcriptional regulator, low CO2-responsive transcriptional regulator